MQSIPTGLTSSGNFDTRAVNFERKTLRVSENINYIRGYLETLLRQDGITSVELVIWSQARSTKPRKWQGHILLLNYEGEMYVPEYAHRNYFELYIRT